jgi:monoamine oxidase
MSLDPDTDVIVVGAGVAGLAASAALRRAGLRCLLLEASDRIGGRAWTTHPPPLGGAAFDHGASWLHAAEHNPLVPIARAHGDPLVDFDGQRNWRTIVDGRPATEAEYAAYERAEARFRQEMNRRATGPDMSLADAAAPFRADPWLPTILAWEGAIIAAADANVLSLKDWRANLLEGHNLAPVGGLGAFIARRLGPSADPVLLRCPVSKIAWDRPRQWVEVATPNGMLTALACIITVSTGVLAAGAIGFDPPLPARTRQAIEDLPMGLLTKIALRATGTDRLGLPDNTTLDRRLNGPDDPATVLLAWPLGADHLICFVGGRTAWALDREKPAAAISFARDTLTALLGARASRAVAQDGVVTRWGGDPWIRGAYAYAVPGRADARAALAEPLADGRLIFAGEACHEGLAGTVAGAFLSGEKAASTVLAAFEKRPG